MKPIFLIGYMGSGKTTLGRALAKFTGKDFIDLDIFIETRFRHTVKDLFAIHGESGFRDIERNVLHEVGAFEDVIIACGGGTPCHFDNIQFMQSQGITVFLQASVQSLVSRLSIPSAKRKRPLIADKTDEELEQFIVKALADRARFYNPCMIHFDSSRLESTQQVEDSVKSLCKLIADCR